MTDILSFISTTQSTDEYADPVIVETRRQVFCRQESIGMKEFYQAAATGLKPEVHFILTDYLDYQGEKLVEHEGHRYHVLRTYRKGQELDLTCYAAVNESVTSAPSGGAV